MLTAVWKLRFNGTWHHVFWQIDISEETAAFIFLCLLVAQELNFKSEMWLDSGFVPITVLVSNCRRIRVLIYICEVGGILGGVKEYSRSLVYDSVLLVRSYRHFRWYTLIRNVCHHHLTWCNIQEAWGFINFFPFVQKMNVSWFLSCLQVVLRRLTNEREEGVVNQHN